MADAKISALAALAGSAVAADDLFAVVDTSATATKKITAEELENWIDSRAHTFAQTQTINPAVDTTALEIVHPVDSTGDLISATMEASPWFVVASDGSVFTRANLRLGSGSAVGTNGQTVIAVGNGTAPTTYPADEFQVWSADISAGNAAMHVAGEGATALVARGGVISGPNGATNPTFQTVTSVASAATGVTVTGRAAGAGVTIAAISSGTNESIDVTPKGNGRLNVDGTYTVGTRFRRVDSVTQYLDVIPSNGGGGESLITSHDELHFCAAGTGSSSSTKAVVVYRRRFRLTSSDFVSTNYTSTFECALANGVVTLDDGSTGGWLQAKGESAVLTADVTNDTATMANLTGLSKPVLSGRKYTFKLVLILNESTDVDGAKVDFDGGTATATYFKWAATAFDSTTFIGLAHGATLAADFTALTLNGDGQIVIEGHFVPSASGTFIPRFAQAAHSTGTLTAYRGSYLWIKDTP